MNTRPPATVGWPAAIRSPGNPKAHRTFRSATWDFVNPALAAGWYRVLVDVTPQPFQADPFTSIGAPASSHRGAAGGGAIEPSACPVTKTAMARRSPSLRVAPWVRIVPVSSAATNRSGASWAIVVRDGTRADPESWHRVQCVA